MTARPVPLSDGYSFNGRLFREEILKAYIASNEDSLGEAQEYGEIVLNLHLTE